MRHRIKTQKLSRFSSYYEATIRSLARAVLTHQRIVTTKVRAKLAKGFVDRLISLGKDLNSLAARRRAFSFLNDHDLVGKLFKEIAPMFSEKHGGYTRIIPYKRRRGDNAELVVLELSMIKDMPRPVKGKQHEKKEGVQKPKAEKPHIEKTAREAEAKTGSSEVAPPDKERHKKGAVKAVPKKPLGGFKKFFKPERDSL